MNLCLRLVVTIAVVGSLAGPAPLLAHADLLLRIAAVTAAIDDHPGDPRLYLKRGDLHAVHRDWEAARRDYLRARQLAPTLVEVDYRMGRMWLDAGRPELAKALLDRFLALRPDHAHALVTRARACAQLGEGRAAVVDFSRAIGQIERPPPELFLERASLLVAAGEVGEALRGIDEGIARLGPAVSLIRFALETEANRGQWEAALDRLDALPPEMREQPFWLARRGDYLASAGHRAEARVAYRSALDAIAALPAGRRTTAATEELETRLRRLLADRSGEA